MKHNEDVTVVGIPKEAGLMGDDHYLMEMTDRLQRLRSLVGERDRRVQKAKRRFSKPKSSNLM